MGNSKFAENWEETEDGSARGMLHLTSMQNREQKNQKTKSNNTVPSDLTYAANRSIGRADVLKETLWDDEDVLKVKGTWLKFNVPRCKCWCLSHLAAPAKWKEGYGVIGVVVARWKEGYRVIVLATSNTKIENLLYANLGALTVMLTSKRSWTSLRTLASVSSETKVMARPLVPNRPARATWILGEKKKANQTNPRSK